MERITVDVAVVGAGFAGLVAAVRAQEGGARVAVVEQTAAAPSWSNSRLAGGNFAPLGLSPSDPAEAFAARLGAAMGDEGDPAVIRAWATVVGRSYRWLIAHGVRFAYLRGKPVLAPVRPNRAGIVWQGRGSDVTLRRLYAEFLQRGGLFYAHTRARELRAEAGRVVGLAAERLEPTAFLEIASQAVVLADGGYASNRELLRKHAGLERLDRILLRGAGSGVGAGIALALAVGADFASPRALFGHLMHRDALWNEQLQHYPFLDSIADRAFVVGADGRRFVDEARGALVIANRLVRLDDPAGGWLILDRGRWETDARLNQAVPPNPNLLVHAARVEVADDLPTLAQRTGLPADALTATLTELDTALRGGQAAHLPVPRTATPAPLRPPYVALPLVVGLTYTLGGPRIDEYGRVVDTARQPIPGLYAAGTTAGGLDGGTKPITAGGIGKAVPLGYLAGEQASAKLTAPAGAR